MNARCVRAVVSCGIIMRSYATASSASSVRPVLTIPAKMQQKLQRALAEKQREQKLQRSRTGNTDVTIIACKNSKLNHYLGMSYGSFDEVPLASKGWQHKKAAGDHFVLQSHGKNPSIISDDTTFTDLRLDDDIVRVLHSMGVEKPTLIQRDGIRPILGGNNCLIAAETGSGKTLCYLAPLVQMVKYLKARGVATDLNSPLVLILTPGRELAEQIGNVCRALCAPLGIESVVEVGGRLKRRVLQGGFSKVDIMISTLGAASKLTTNQVYNMKDVEHIVLDEADTLLDDSFSDKLVHFLRKFPLQAAKTSGENGPTGVQVIMASATIPTSAERILANVLPYSSFTRATTDYLHRLLPHVTQRFLRLAARDKPVKLIELVKRDVNGERSVIIFSGKSETSDWISLLLKDNGIECINLNGAMSQRLREDRFKAYSSGKVRILSCTDIVSRGLDTQGTHHVINYDMATNMSDYIHRCGRVGRVGSRLGTGLVTNFVSRPAEIELVQKIEYAARKTDDSLPNVNANVKRLILSHLQKKQNAS